MIRSRTMMLLAAGLLLAGFAAAQDVPDDNAVWSAFIGWFRTAQEGRDMFGMYSAKLGAEGVSAAEVQRRLKTIVRLFSERPEGAEVFYDRSYSRPLTGDASQDTPRVPSAFVVEAAKGLKPGAALDVGAGQGRNAVFLAREGWDVTAMDISQAGLDAARADAAKAGVGIRTEKGAYETFDFGVGRWDLIAIVFAWAPVADPAFVSKLKASLRPGGVMLFEHFIDSPEDPYAPMVRAVMPNALKDYFADFEIVSYEETVTTADWGGPGSRVVRMVARKKA
jgi:2-polyprenyl-3-methyl-5-hydroxy-6-metoxy-1,4-benzoquinol methylase